MNVILRAYDHEQVLRAELLPVQRLWTLLESGGMRDRSREREGLMVPADVWAREALVARLEGLMQEGFGQENLSILRGGPPSTVSHSRHTHWPPIDPTEAVELHEDLVRYFTYGLWQSLDSILAAALSVLRGGEDVVAIEGDSLEAALYEVLPICANFVIFSDRFMPAMHRAANDAGADSEMRAELYRIWLLLAPAAQLDSAALQAGLRVIAYRDAPGGAGLTASLARAMEHDHHQ